MKVSLLLKVIAAIVFILFLKSCSAPTANLPDINSIEIKEQEERQKRLSYLNYTKQFQRTHNIVFKINLNNENLCQKKNYDFGFRVANSDVIGEDAAFYPKDLNLGTKISVVSIANDSSSKKAGLMIGDKIESINQSFIDDGKIAIKSFAKIKDENSKNENVNLAIIRDGSKMNINFIPDRVCAYPLMFTRGQEINAYADGNNIFITQGIAEYTLDDNELALVVGHELAHNNRNHIDAKKKNALAGALFGFVVDMAVIAAGGYSGGEYTDIGAQLGSQAWSVEFEQEADYAGLYYAKRAGFDVSKANEFWTRMGAKNPQAIAHNSTHPATAKRFVSLKATLVEIENKIQNGAEIIPNEKIKQVEKKEQKKTKFSLKKLLKKQ